jgi:SAM-dependent methyltransferase
VSLHPLVSGFAGDVYERGRPPYWPEVARLLTAELDLEAGAPVLDLGAGTGKLSAALMQAGLDVRAVEPLADMRAVLARTIGDDRALEGTAEAIPLPGDSMAAVTMADSFHWFDEGSAIEEIRRVLRPGGGVAVMFTAPGWHGAGFEWAGELGDMMKDLRGDHPIFSGRHRGAEASFADAGGFAPVYNRGVDVERETDRATVMAYIASISWVGSLPDAERSAFLGDVERLLDRHGVDRVRSAVHTELFLTRRL